MSDSKGDPASIDKKAYREKLLAMQAELKAFAATTDAAAKPVELDQTRVGRVSRMDAMQAQAMSQEAQRRRELQLTRIHSALERLQRDEFGVCIRCGEDIGEQRLAIDPTILLCIGCANAWEQRQ